MDPAKFAELSWSTLMFMGNEAHRLGQEAIGLWLAEVRRRLPLLSPHLEESPDHIAKCPHCSRLFNPV